MVSLEEAVNRLVLEGTFSVGIKNTSYLGLTAGDIVSFEYRGKPRFGFILMSSRTGVDGLFSSARTRNTLLNFVSADTITEDEFMDAVYKLYDTEVDPVVSNFDYDSARGGSTVTSKYTGSDQFRTMNVALLSGASINILDIVKINNEPELS